MDRVDFTYVKKVGESIRPNYVKVKCTLCDKVYEIYGKSYKGQRQRSCGCLRNILPDKYDLTGKDINGIRVIGLMSRGNWRVEYSCGHTGELKTSLIRRRKCSTCESCMRKDYSKWSAKKHGMSKNNSTYRSWNNMRRRCYDESNNRYEYYGGKGIKVCDRWNPKKGGSFENFLEDMGECPQGMSIERIDLNKDYTPDNCKWADDLEQANNKRSNLLITDGEETWSLRRWCEKLGLNYKSSFYKYRYKGMDIKEILGHNYCVVQDRYKERLCIK